MQFPGTKQLTLRLKTSSPISVKTRVSKQQAVQTTKLSGHILGPMIPTLGS